MSAKIVIVEDDVFLAEIYQTRMHLAGHTCYVANDGLTGLQLIKQMMPDLVLLDLMLPQMSGDEVLAAMRKSDWGKDIKVLILTNLSETEAPDNLKNYHFERYLVKANLSGSELNQIVADILTKTPPAAPQTQN